MGISRCHVCLLSRMSKDSRSSICGSGACYCVWETFIFIYYSVFHWPVVGSEVVTSCGRCTSAATLAQYATPLVGVLVSLAIYLAATLFPKWLLPIHVWMNQSWVFSSDSCNELHDLLREEQVFAYVKVATSRRTSSPRWKSRTFCVDCTLLLPNRTRDLTFTLTCVTSVSIIFRKPNKY
jgi:hypothetical protein